MGVRVRGLVTPSTYFLFIPPCLPMDLTPPFSSEVRPMDSPLDQHPYAQFRKFHSTSTHSLATHFPPVPTLSAIKDLGSWLPSMGSDHGLVTASLSVMAPPSEKLDISPPATPAHGFPYVKHANGITMILSGQKAGTSVLPYYPSGSSISGMVVLSKLENIASLDVKVGDPFICARIRGMPKLISGPSWKGPSLFAKSRQAAGVIPSFHLIG